MADSLGAGDDPNTPSYAHSAAHSYSENIKHSRTNFFVLLLGQLYCLLTVETTRDAALLSNSLTQKMPILETSISIETFYLIAPLLLLILFFHFQIHLKSFWSNAATQARRDGRDLVSLVDTYPWFVTSAMTRRFLKDAPDRAGFSAMFEYVAGLLFAWFSTAIVLIIIWGRFLTKHDFPIAIYHSALVAIAISGSIYFLFAARTSLIGTALSTGGALARGLIVILSFLIPFVTLVGLSWWLFEARDESGCLVGDDTPECVEIFERQDQLARFGLNVSAALEGVDILSRRPENWLPTRRMELTDLAAVDGADLRGEDLRYAAASDAIFVRADLAGANLRLGDFRRAWFLGADLRRTDLSASNFEAGAFDYANLSYARLDRAQIDQTSFFRAALFDSRGASVIARDADFTEARFSDCLFSDNSDFRQALFIRAEMINCTFSDVVFSNSNFTGAQLNGSKFRSANLAQARFDDAELVGAELDRVFAPQARFEQARLVDAVITGLPNQVARFDLGRFERAFMERIQMTDASFVGADLRSVDMRSATLTNVDFTDVDMSGARLNSAVLDNVDFSGATLENTELTDADLSGAKNLTQEQLDRACGQLSHPPRLPDGLTLSRACPLQGVF